MAEDTLFSRIFRKIAANSVPMVSFGLATIFTLLFLVFYYAPPGSDIGPEQPIPFSHRVHSGVKNISCEFCHPYAGQSTFPGLPPVEKCLYCHNYIIANHPWIQKEHEYFDTNTPIPWRKVNYLPEHAFFNHERHIKKEIECQACHGAVETMDRLTAKPFRMEFCIGCHRELKANLDCWLACHN